MSIGTKAKIDRAKSIASHGPNIAYISRGQSERVRAAIRDLLDIIEEQQREITSERELSAALLEDRK